jgi:membrane protein required for colicin V production
MNSLDWMLLTPFFLSGLWGVWRGLVREAMSIGAWVLGVVLAGRYAAELGPRLPIDSQMLAHALAWVLLLALVLMVSSVLAKLLKQLLTVTGLGVFDRLLGGCFGLLRGSIFVMLLVWVIGLTSFKKYPIWGNSLVVPVVQQMLEQVKPVLPVQLERLVS